MDGNKDIFFAIKKEVRFESSRSSGPGGQNVNKRSTKVTGLWNFSSSKLISDQEKRTLAQELKSRILSGRVLVFSSQKHRSQSDNKKDVIDSMSRAAAKALKVKIPRIPTKPTASKVKKRLDEKKKHSRIKSIRKLKGE